MRDRSIFRDQPETDYEKRELEVIRRLKLEGKFEEADELYQQLQTRIKKHINQWEKR